MLKSTKLVENLITRRGTHSLLGARHKSTLGTRFTRSRTQAQRAWENWRKEAVRERLRVYAERTQATSKFNEWRRQHTLALVVAGGVGGAVAAGVIAIYVLGKPRNIERALVREAVEAFDGALNFNTRRGIFHRLPDISVPAPEMPTAADLASGEGTKTPLQMWAQQLVEAVDEVDNSFLIVAKEKLRERLLEEAATFPDLQQRLMAIASLLPPSLERGHHFDQQYRQQLESTGWIPADALDMHQPQEPATPCVIMNKIVAGAIAFFPGPTNLLVFVLHGHLSVDKAVAEMSSCPEEAAVLSRALSTIQTRYAALPKELAAQILQSSVATTISSLPKLSSGTPQLEPTPYQLYVRALDTNLLQPLSADARIGQDILSQVKGIFLALPADIQARVLLTAILHPSSVDAVNNVNPSRDQTAALVTDLLSSGGIVAVKLAQMLAEHPKVPNDYRLLLGSLRDSNEAMDPRGFWWRVPKSIRSQMTHLGPCLGTGSVKQVQAVKFKGDKEFAVAILRRSVEDEALSSINALQVASEDLGPVAKRLGKMVYGEFDLFNEGESLQEFATTSIGLHPLFKVVGVKHHSPNCLVEEAVHGPTVAKVLDSKSTPPEEIEETKQILAEYHRTVFQAFVTSGLIHSDIHLGNAVKTTHPSGEAGFVLFDVGQVERIGDRDKTAILWTMASLSSPERRISLKDICISHLIHASSSIAYNPSLTFDSSSTAPTSTAPVPAAPVSKKKEKETAEKKMRHALSFAFDEAISPLSDGSLPDARTAFMLFLRASEREGVEMPKGAFAVAKMMDAMLSQQEWYDLEPVAEDCMTRFLKKNITWGETISLAWKSLKK